MERDEHIARHPVARLLLALAGGLVAILLAAEPIAEAYEAGGGPRQLVATVEPAQDGNGSEERGLYDVDDTDSGGTPHQMIAVSGSGSSDYRARAASASRSHLARGPPAL